MSRVALGGGGENMGARERWLPSMPPAPSGKTQDDVITAMNQRRARSGQ